ncbi:flagellar hook-associated protein FlgK [Desulfitobacterium chlororespirans]|uniref:Flagellar hook-associated protein 1 n=1 Tax=Desulfitobacterium chlororespirans DSM 11544 TaxID=1121395 RepID=A0A1M7UCY3_9FIRM|nr:flagellar hook-associated protein FlgK [Desulfitobacterium chlororespirans]SHN80912.1 flagellar hook-associated protein 1 FlgK [Desulfitobacterium chlororespirans DSM 11544]
MRSTFSGLELARRALESQQIALDTTGHNIANANTIGYTRQVVNLQATLPDSIPGMGHYLSIGTGVTVQSIDRARDIFIDRQFRWENSKHDYWATRENTLAQIEGLLNEPSDNSLSNDLTQFWSAWSVLANNPENLGARSVILERAATLADTLHHIDQQITEAQKSLDSSVRVQIDQINSYANQIQELNFQIKKVQITGDNPNDLLDKRDALIDDLSKLVNVRVVESRDPNFTDREVNIFKLYIGNEKATNQILVDDTKAYQLATPETTDADGLPFAEVKWAAGHPQAGASVDLGEGQGELQSSILMRGSGFEYSAGDTKATAHLAYLRDQFNQLARGIAEALNAIHRTGIDKEGNLGEDFFTSADGNPISAGNIKVNQDLIDDPWKIATGKDNFGDGEIAKALSSLATGWTGLTDLYLKNPAGNTVLIDPATGAITTDTAAGRPMAWATSADTPLEYPVGHPLEGDPILIDPATGTITTDTAVGRPVVLAQTPPLSASSIGDYYGAALAELGVDAQQATRMKESQAVLVTHMYNQRQSVVGVNMDEEITNLIKFQKSYTAAARIVTMLDSMLDTIVNGMGVTR